MVVTLSYSRTGTNTQTFAGTTVNAGAAGLFTTVSTQTIAFGGITRNIGGTFEFASFVNNSGSAGATFTTTNTNDSTGILGGWATDGYKDWASNNGTKIVPYPIASYTGNTWASTNNTTVTSTNSPASNSTTNSLRFGVTGAFTVTLAGTNVISSGGVLLNSDAGNDLVSGGILTSGNGTDLIVHVNTATAVGSVLTIGSTIADNGLTSIGLTKSGWGQASLTGANTYTGPTYVNAGSLTLANAGALGTSSGVTVAYGAGLRMSGGISTTAAVPLTLNGDGITSYSSAYAMENVSGTNTYSGLVTLGSSTTIGSTAGTLNLTNTARSAARASG